MHRTALRLLVALFVVAAGGAGFAGPALATADGGAQVDESDAPGIDGPAAPQVEPPECGYPVTVEDAGGAEVTLDEAPERVVTLNPSAAQTLWEVGAEDTVVGLSEHALYLDGADERETVETYPVSTESVVDLEPDLVLAPNTIPPDAVEELRDAGITVFHFESAESFEAVAEKTFLIGQLVGACDGAEETVEWMDEELGVVERAVADEDHPPVHLEFFGTSADGTTFQHDILATAGGDNIAADADFEGGWGSLSDEVIVDEDPEWLIVPENADVPDREAVQSTTAYQEDQIVQLPSHHLQQPAPRVVHGVATLAESIHPDAYAEAEASATDASYGLLESGDDGTEEQDAGGDTDAEGDPDEEGNDGNDGDDGDDGETETLPEEQNESEGSDDGDDGDAQDDEDSIPGFGVPAAIAAVLALAFARRR